MLTRKIAVTWEVAEIVRLVAGYHRTENTGAHHHHEADFAPKRYLQVPKYYGRK